MIAPMADVVFPRHEHYMRLALREARRGRRARDVPVGCVIVLGGEVIAAAGNERELRQSPRRTPRCSPSRRRPGASALAAAQHHHLRHPRALPDVRRGDRPGAHPAPRLRRAGRQGRRRGHALRHRQDPRLNHRVEVTSGLLADASVALLQGFFPARR